MELLNVTTENVSFKFDKEKILLKDIVIKNKKVINEISFQDLFCKELESYEHDYSHIPIIQNILKNAKWDVSTATKRKETIIFTSTKYELLSKPLHISINIFIRSNEIVIQSTCNSKTRIFFGISPKVTTSEKIVLPVELADNSNVLTLHENDKVSISKDEVNVDILTTLSRIEKIKNSITFSPLTYGNKRKVFKSWEVYKSNKNFNALVIKF